METRSRVLLILSTLGALRAFTDKSFCRDLTDYGDLTYINQTVNVCSYELEKKCQNKTETLCSPVTETDCEVELFTKCSMNWTRQEVPESRPTTLFKTLPTCVKQLKKEEHNKTHYECRNVTRQHCTSLWKVVKGEKVWAGNEDDCRDVTWEECNPVPVTVQWEVPFMNCTHTDHPYLSYQNTTRSVMADTMDCEVQQRVVCKPRESTKCGSITYTTCQEVTVPRCEPVSVPCPYKEKLHKQFCLFGTGSIQPPADGQTEPNQEEEEKEIPKFGLNKDGSLDWILTEIKRLEKEGDLVQ